MFDHAATSPYHPFFTSGLLSAARTRFPSSPSSNSPTSPDVPLSPRRGSLPDNYPLYSSTNDDDGDYDHENDDVFNFYHADAEDTMYFTLQPRTRPSAENLRSFLSLDLADSQSMRSASLRRKPSSSTARSNWSRSTLSKSTKAYSGFRFPETIPELPSRPNALPQPPHTAPLPSKSATPPLSPLTVPSQTAAGAINNNRRPSTTTLRLRFSRDSLRTMPSPKPAPCITLPEPPKTSRAGTPVSVHHPSAPAAVAATAAMATTSAMTAIIAPSAVPTPVAVPVPAPVRAPTPSTIITTSTSTSTASASFIAPAPAAATLSQAEPKTPVKTKAPPRLPSLQHIPLELNIRMSALFASPPKPSSSKAPTLPSNASSNAKPSKTPSMASSRFISPAPRQRLERGDNRRTTRNRESVATMLTTRTVSTRGRRFNRSEALARLEGRSPVSPQADAAGQVSTARTEPAAATVTATKLAMRMSASRNFMSMSDDEDEDESEGEIQEEEDSGGEMVFLRQVAEGAESDLDDEEDLDFDDGCSSSSSSSSAGSESSSSYVSLDKPLAAAGVVKHATERGSGSSSGSGSASSGLSFPSLRGLVGRMAGLNPFMEAEDVVLPIQTLSTPTTTTTTPTRPASQAPLDDDPDVDIDDNFRFPAPPRTTAAERRLSLALSFGSSAFDTSIPRDDSDNDNLSVSVFDGLFLEAPRSAPLPPAPPPYSPFAQAFPAFAQPLSAAPAAHKHLAVPTSGPSNSSSSLALPGLRRKRTKTRKGRADHSGLVSFIDFPDVDAPPASAPPAPRPSMMTMSPPRRVIGERSDSLPEEMRELHRRMQRLRTNKGAAAEDGQDEEAQTKTRSNRGSKDSTKDGSGSGSKSSSWTWRSFIEVANV